MDAPTPAITILAKSSTRALTRTVTITVIEGGGDVELAPAAAIISAGATSRTLIAAIIGLVGGVKISTTTQNDGQLALDGTRRNLIIGVSAIAAGTFAPTLTTNRGRAGSMEITAKPAKIWRGLGQAMRMVEGTTGGGSNTNILSRVPFYSPQPFRRLRPVYAVFRPTGSPIRDALFQGNMAQMVFQGGLEYPYTPAVSGLAPRIPFAFAGVDTAAYDYSTWNASSGLIVGDAIDVGQVIPANTAFGIWSYAEVPSVLSSNALPYNWQGSNYINRYMGTSFSATARRGDAHTAASISAVGTTQTGASQMFCPVALLIEVLDGTECVVVLGDSKGKGVGEGNAGSGAFGDVWGDEFGRKGIFERGIGHNHPAWLSVNIAQGSDGNKFQYVAGSMKYRLELLSLCNPTRIINGFAHNDLTQTATISNWVTATTYVRGDSCVVNGQGIYACLHGGTSGSVAPSETGNAIADNDVVWAFLTSSVTGETQRVMQQFSHMVEVNRQLRAAAPTALLYGFAAEPGVTLTSGGGNPDTEQAVLGGFGDATSRRGLWNTRVRELDPLLGLAGYIETNPYVEYQYPVQTSKWAHGGVANLLTKDGVHENSYGYSQSALGVVIQS